METYNNMFLSYVATTVSIMVASYHDSWDPGWVVAAVVAILNNYHGDSYHKLATMMAKMSSWLSRTCQTRRGSAIYLFMGPWHAREFLFCRPAQARADPPWVCRRYIRIHITLSQVDTILCCQINGGPNKRPGMENQ